LDLDLSEGEKEELSGFFLISLKGVGNMSGNIYNSLIYLFYNLEIT